ncbi:unnamed protein product [Victoria cruziana]
MSSSSSATLKGCCCCFFLLLTFLALVVVAVVVVVVLAVKPRKPQLDLQAATVQYLLVETPPGGPGSGVAYLSLNISMLFSASNPNRVGIKYAPSTFYVMYEGVPLGVAEFPGFYQPAYSRTPVETRVSVQRVNVMQKAAADLVRDATVTDRVEFSVKGDVGARIRALGITLPNVEVSVDCVIVVSPRKQSVTYKQCGLGLNV